MIEKLKKMLKNKKNENLIVFLIILVITLVIINNIIKGDDKETKKDKYLNAELAVDNINTNVENDLEKRLKNILSKIDGVGEVSVLVTYSESKQIIPMYNQSMSKSITEEKDTSGGIRTIESEDNESSVVTGSDSNPVTQKTINPILEGAIVTAQGAGNSNVKTNIISAVEAVTGLATHKIRVFEQK